MKKMTIRLPDDYVSKLKEEADKKDVNVVDLVRELVINSFHGEGINRYEFLGDACSALCYVDDHYECTWGRLGNVPNTKKLGKTEDAVKERCRACKETIKIKDMENENMELKTQLKQDIKIEIPVCGKGGRVNEDVDRMWCPDISKERPILERKNKDDYVPCKLAGKQNAQCSWLKLSCIKVSRSRG